MTIPRRPRFKRIQLGRFHLTERDKQVLRIVHRHRFLRSTHILSLINGSRQQILRRLTLLYHHGYLERPRQQIDQYITGGSKHIIYGIGNKSVPILKLDGKKVLPELSWNEKNIAIGKVFLNHALLVSDIMVSIELSCRNRGVRLVRDKELLPPDGRLFRWKVKASGATIFVAPDCVFRLEIPNGEIFIFCLEADRGTMPVMRAQLYQTSFNRKLIAYHSTWRQMIHKRRFGWSRFRVLTVTTGPERIANIQKAARTLNGGQGLFLFLDESKLAQETDFFTLDWQTCQNGETERLLN